MCPVQTAVPNLDEHTALIGTWRQFGTVGPVYQIVSTGRELPDGDRMMRIRVLEAGEEADYRFTHILDDPRAQ